MKRPPYSSWLNLAACLAAILLCPTPASPAAKPVELSFPARPITIIVPFGPGGGSHQMATHIAVPLSSITGVDVDVVTIAGHGSKDGIAQFVQSAPDGYTILQHVDILASLFAKGEIDVNPVRDLTPVAITQITFSQIYIRNIEARFHNWSGFLDFARRHPDQLKIANTGSASSLEQISMLQLSNRLKFKMQSWTFDRPAERYMALVEEKVDALFEQPGDVAPFLNRKLIKPILTILPERIDAFAYAPALRDIGDNEPALLRFRGFFVRADVPEKIKQYLEAAFRKAYQSPSFQAFNRKAYMHFIDSYRNSDDAKKLVGDAVITYSNASSGNR